MFSVKNYEGSEVLANMKANEWACHYFIEVGRRCENHGSETKAFITHSTASGMSISIFVSVSLVLKSRRTMWKDMDGCWMCSELHYRRGTLSLENLDHLQWEESLPNFCSSGKKIFQDYSQQKYPWKHSPEQREVSASLTRCAEMQELSPNSWQLYSR